VSQTGDERAKFCRYCDGVIEFGTKRCPHCNADLEIVDFDDMDFVAGAAAPPPKVSGLRDKPALPADMERRRKPGVGDTQAMPAMRKAGPADETSDMAALDADLVPIPTAPVMKPVGGPAGKPPVVPPLGPGGRKTPLMKPAVPPKSPPVLRPAAPAGPPPVLKPAAPPVLKPAAAPPPVLKPAAGPAAAPVLKPIGPMKGPPVLKPRAPAPVMKPVEEVVEAPEPAPAPPPVLKPAPAGLPTGVEPVEPDCPVCGSPIQVAGGSCPSCGAEACMACLMRANGVAVGEDPKANRKAWTSFLNKTPPDQVRCAACGLSGVKA
jgi:hypothetical protein